MRIGSAAENTARASMACSVQSRSRARASICSAVFGLLCLTASSLTATAAPAALNTRPNIVVVVVDDAGYTDFGAYGGEIATPTIDALAARGVRFANFHAAPMCAPSRAMLLTGVDSHTAGIANLPETTPRAHKDKAAYRGALAANVTTVASMLQAGGYRTYMAGKWHLGHDAANLPSARGFDRSYALDATGGDNWEQRPYIPIYKTADWFENGKPATLPKDFYSSKFLVDRMISYIDQAPADSRPFFAYLPFLAIHIPVQAPPEFVRKYAGAYADGWQAQRQRRYEGAIRTGLIDSKTPLGATPTSVGDWNKLSPAEQLKSARAMAVSAGMLEAMDHHLGRLIDHLKATGRYENTLFVVLSDNGPEAADPMPQPVFRFWMKRVGYDASQTNPGPMGTFAAIGPGWASAAAAPGTLYKFYASEGGMRVPLIVAGPGVATGALTRAFSIVTDITPTLLDYAVASGSGPPSPALVGRSLKPLLTGAEASIYGPDDAIGLEAAGEGALFKGDFKLTRSQGGFGDPKWRLYDIRNDPGETRDLTAAMPDRAAAMLADYQAFAARVGVSEVPEGYAADREAGGRILRGIVRDMALPLAVALAFLLGLVGFLGLWLLRRLPTQLIQTGRTGVIMRVLIGLVGLFGLLVASQFWLRPQAIAATMGLEAVGPSGLGTLRADMAGFFGAVAVMALLAAIRNDSRWLRPVVLLLSLALMGRVLNLVLSGGGAALIPPMVVEVVLISIVSLGLRVLPRRP